MANLTAANQAAIAEAVTATKSGEAQAIMLQQQGALDAIGQQMKELRKRQQRADSRAANAVHHAAKAAAAAVATVQEQLRADGRAASAAREQQQAAVTVGCFRTQRAPW